MKLKDTKLGQWLKTNTPKVLDVVGDVLPDKGILGIVKNIIDMDNSVLPEQKLEFERNQQIFLLELEKVESIDRQGARTRETDFVKSTSHMDWMMWALALSAVCMMGYCLYHLVHEEIANKELFIHFLGILEGLVVAIFTYYFGSSAGSRIKDMKK